MKKELKYASDIAEAVHTTVEGMYRAGTIDKATMKSFDESCLTVPAALKPKEIRKLRLRSKLSQPVFARYLNVSESTIEKWETGAKKPSGIALKMLAVVEKHGLEILS